MASFLGHMSSSTAEASPEMIEADPERDVQRMLLDLFNIAGYGVHSGIHPGPKADEAIDYILKKLRSAGLTNARLDPVKVNDAFPKSFAMNVNARGEKTRPVSGFPKTRPNTPLKVRIAVLSDTVHAGDKVWAADDDMVFSDDKTCYRYPGLPDWPSLKWDWGGRHGHCWRGDAIHAYLCLEILRLP